MAFQARGPRPPCPATMNGAPHRYVGSIRVWLTEAANFGEGFSANNEFAQQRQEECLAETADWRIGFEVKRTADDVGVELVENDPEGKIPIKAGAPLLYGGNFDAETAGLRLPGRDGKEEDQIAVGTWEMHADGNGALLAPLGLTGIRLPCPQVWIADDGRRLDLGVAQDRLPSSS
ncbi:hypothetical protein MPLB_480005 [Mesorhizobium sp. ORS 3324]|nr:hypothetical protein MPLB_480005 [Mesorhizobium sp. ORS 3324]